MHAMTIHTYAQTAHLNVTDLICSNTGWRGFLVRLCDVEDAELENDTSDGWPEYACMYMYV
jgi:hypothetical protein